MKKKQKIKVNYLTIADEDRKVKTGIIEVEDIYQFEGVEYIEFVDEDGHQFSMALCLVEDALLSGSFSYLNSL